MPKDYQEEKIDIAIANLVFAGLSIAQIEKIPKWLLENMEKNKPGFKEFMTTYGNARVEEIIKNLDIDNNSQHGKLEGDLEIAQYIPVATVIKAIKK